MFLAFYINLNALHLFGDIVITQLFHDLLGPVDHHFRHPCQLCHLDTVTFIGTAFYNLTKEYDIVSLFLDRNTVIIHIVHLAFQLRQLMIMGGKKSLGPQNLPVADMLDHRPGNT